jgi:hypothetical protein
MMPHIHFRCLVFLQILSLAFAAPALGGNSAIAVTAVSEMVAQTTKITVRTTVKRKKTFPQKKKKTPYRPVKRWLTVAGIEARSVYVSMKNWNATMCIKEVPFLLALHRAYYKDARLFRGDTLALANETVMMLVRKASDEFSLPELLSSSIAKIDSMYIFKERKNRVDSKICNMVLYVVPGDYEIPNTGASITLPAKIAGSVSYNVKTGKMVVYIHTGGIQLQLPGYAKALTFGLLKDMDIGFAELERVRGAWTARLLYVGDGKDAKKKGWTLNITECNKIRPY